MGSMPTCGEKKQNEGSVSEGTGKEDRGRSHPWCAGCGETPGGNKLSGRVTAQGKQKSPMELKALRMSTETKRAAQGRWRSHTYTATSEHNQNASGENVSVNMKVSRLHSTLKGKNFKLKTPIKDVLEDCVYCGKTFPHKLLIKHKTDEEKCLRCRYCDKDFENVHLFRRHTYRYHKFYSCKICNLRFLKGAYEYHMSSVHRDRPECKICSKTFATKLSLLAHEKKIHLGQRDERFQCQNCKYKAPDKFQYTVHLARHNKSPFFVCDYCGAGHYTKTELKKHIQADHCGGYPCDKCSKSFRSPEYLKRHKLVHEPDYDPSKVNFTCEECGKGFLNKFRFKRHSLRHKDQLPTYDCDSCGKSLTSKASFETHIRMHTGSKPYKCPECGKAFSGKRYLVDHVRHHNEEKTFNCNICKENFLQYGLLVNHKKIHAKA